MFHEMTILSEFEQWNRSHLKEFDSVLQLYRYYFDFKICLCKLELVIMEQFYEVLPV